MVIGREKVWSLIYTDDTVLVARTEKGNYGEAKEILQKERIDTKCREVEGDGIPEREWEKKEKRMEMGGGRDRGSEKDEIFGICIAKKWRSGETC